MNKTAAVATGIAIGGGLMYLFDPDRGKRRRALLRDTAVSAVDNVDAAICRTSRGIGNRTRGLVADARSLLTGSEVPDGVLAARVQSKTGQAVSYPRAIDVTADEGTVTLRGDVLASEEENLVRAVASVRGVKSVRNRLVAHERAEGVSALQVSPQHKVIGIKRRETQLSPAERILMSATGGALAVYAITHRNLLGMGAGAAGSAMLARGIAHKEFKRLRGIRRAISAFRRAA